MDEDGNVHFGDGNAKPEDAESVEVAPANAADPLADNPALEPKPKSDEPPKPKMTPRRWAAQNCTPRSRILYTDQAFFPCVPTSEVSVWVCQKEAPLQFRRALGKAYKYENKQSECGPEVYRGEVVYID